MRRRRAYVVAEVGTREPDVYELGRCRTCARRRPRPLARPRASHHARQAPVASTFTGGCNENSSIVLAVSLALLSACASRTPSSSPSASPAFTDAAECERNGGVWRPDLGFCELSWGGLKSRVVYLPYGGVRLGGLLFVLAAFIALLSACADRTTSSSPSASPDFTPQARCERDGGVWHAKLGICEVPSPRRVD